jgi:hypothetical protein
MKLPTILHRLLLMLDQHAADAGRPTPGLVRRAADQDAHLSRRLSQQRAIDALLHQTGRAQRRMLPAEDAPMPLRFASADLPTADHRVPSRISPWAWLGPLSAAAALWITATSWWSWDQATDVTAHDPTGDLATLIERMRETGQFWSSQLETLESSWTPPAPRRAPAEVLTLAAAAGEDPLQREWAALRVTMDRTVSKLAHVMPVSIGGEVSPVNGS